MGQNVEAQRARDRIALRVVEAPESDVGMGRARVDRTTRMNLGNGETEGEGGAVIEIIGKKSTAAKLFRLTRGDEGKGIIRIDGLVRRNVGVSIGDKVEVRKADVFAAERVTIAPIISEGHKISFGQGIENFVKRGLLKRPLTKGDVVIIPGIALMGGALPFMVVATNPQGIVRVADHTVIIMMEEPVRLQEGLAPNDIVRAFTHGLREFLQGSAYEIHGLEGDIGDRVRAARARILAILDDVEGETGAGPPKNG